jgi:hypothetical protein
MITFKPTKVISPMKVAISIVNLTTTISEIDKIFQTVRFPLMTTGNSSLTALILPDQLKEMEKSPVPSWLIDEAKAKDSKAKK